MADLRITDLPVANVVKTGDIFYVIQDDSSKQISAANLFNNINNAVLRGNLALDSNVQVANLASGYFINNDTLRTEFVAYSNTTSYASLPDGFEGQLKVLTLANTLGGSIVINASNSNISGQNNITFFREGDTALLMYSGNAWIILGSSPGLVSNISGTTDDIIEALGTSNRYFTTPRARGSISAGDNTIIYDKTNGTIKANVVLLANLDLSVFNTDQLQEGANNKYFTNARVAATLSQALSNVRIDIDRPPGKTLYVASTGNDSRDGRTQSNAVANIHIALQKIQQEFANVTGGYNKTKCRRDTGLIVDSIAFDLAYGGNTQSVFSGLQYWAQSTSAIPTQQPETIDAIEYINILVANIIANTAPAVTYLYGGNTARTLVAAVTNTAVTGNISNNFTLITDIISNGTVGITDRVVPNQYPASSNPNIINSANAILVNKTYIQEQTLGYVKSTYPGFFSNANNFINVANAETKCFRDTGFILDTIRFDLLHGGNRQSIQSGVYYYNYSTNVTQIQNQVAPTAAAFTFIGTVVPAIISGNKAAYIPLQANVSQNVIAAPAVVAANVSAVANLVIGDLSTLANIITFGPNVAPSKYPISANASTDANIVNATKLILANKEFIKEEVIRFVDTTYPDLALDANTVPTWYTVKVSSGEYTLYGNPVTIPARTALIGDNLRTTSIYPQNPTDDMFYVNNASYVWGFTFRGHQAPAAAFAFNPDGSAGTIVTSPYIQNCSSITTTGTGMRVDGGVVEGLRSMVLDAYTQTNSGGIGVHMLNRGYTQLVSLFTICCRISVLAESGGFCSITNSNSSFGDYGLVANGVSNPLYYGKVQGDTSGRIFVIYNLTQRPNIGDSVLFANYNQAKCSRDTRLIVDSLAIDLAFTSNTQSSFAGLQYWAQSETEIPGQTTQTVAALNYAKRLATNVVVNIGQSGYFQNTNIQIYANASPGSTYTANLVGIEFDLITNIISNGTVGVTDAIQPNQYPANTLPAVLNAANLIQLNKTFIASEVLAFVNTTYPTFTYNSALCFRDVRYILDSITFDLRYTGNRQAIMSGVYYYNFNANVTQINNQVVQTGAAYEYIKNMLPAILTANSNAYTRLQTSVSQNTTAASAATLNEYDYVANSINLIVNIIENGPNEAPSKRPIELTPNVSTNAVNATRLLLANKDFIAAEVLQYVNTNWSNISNGTVDFYTVDSSTNLVANTATISFASRIFDAVLANTTVSFHQPSYISASGHTFEYVGSGINLATALPYAGGRPIQDNEVVETRGGAVYYTSTDHLGDFRIGNELLFQRASGTINGRTFNKSLFAVMTPYILALEG
ncbi:MAG: hypothetical protein EBU90_11000 [Proteobacteria bacterium]|nr:hypothetical protein [Pseudomonadota bacterium]NBP14434.1 hypothetical protein [bacterium]